MPEKYCYYIAMMCRVAGRCLLALTSMLMFRATAQTVTTYTSLQSWQAAVASNWQFATNFQSVPQDRYFQTSPVSFGPFSLEQIGTDPTFGFFQNFIDVPPLQFSDNDGSTNAALFTKSGVTTVNMNFASPVYAWGANFFGAQTGELTNLVLYNPAGSVVATVPVTVNNGFFGFTLPSTSMLGKIVFESQLKNPDPTVGQGVGLENLVGAYGASPSVVAPSRVSVTASGLAYSRVTQTFNGTITVTNVSGAQISGPFEVVLKSIPSGVTMTNAWGTFGGNPYVISSTASLAPGQSVTMSVQFANPSNSIFVLTPAVYAGAL